MAVLCSVSMSRVMLSTGGNTFSLDASYVGKPIKENSKGSASDIHYFKAKFNVDIRKIPSSS